MSDSFNPISRSFEALDRRRAVRDEEEADTLRRVAVAVRLALVLWPWFGLMDWAMVTWVYEAPLWPFVVMRGGLWLYAWVTFFLLRRRPHVSVSLARGLEIGMFTAGAACIAVMCLLFGQVANPYAPGIIVVMVARIATQGDHWRRGLLPYGLMCACFPVAIAVGMLVDEEIAAQMADPAVVTEFLLILAYLMTGAVIGVYAGHVTWAMRRQVVELGEKGRYELRDRIGKGGMGEVWLARDSVLKRDVAVKLIRAGERGNESMIARFEREVMLTTRLTHPNTVRVLDFGIAPDGQCYFTMELLQGVGLKTFVANEWLSESKILTMALQICGSLAEAHAAGIVHRDIKPDNIFVVQMAAHEHFIKVLDFGIAKSFTDSVNDLTLEGLILGTPRYISPEAIRGDLVAAPADVYAVGCLLYFLLTGAPPFTTGDAAKILLQHLNEPPEPPSRHTNRPIGPELEAVLLRCLAKQPSDRYQDAGALRDALRPIAAMGSRNPSQ